MKLVPSVNIMLVTLIGAFALSQAYRTIVGVMAPVLQTDLLLTSAELGVVAAMFHFVFAAMQLFMGAGLDFYGIRRVMLSVFPLAVLGAFLSAIVPSYSWLLLGQALIGVGCAPAFVACTIFIARRFDPSRFAALSGLAMGLGSLGMLLTAAPLAWLIEVSSWRVGFAVLGVFSAMSWLAMLRWLRLEAPPRVQGESVWGTLKGFLGLFALPHTWGIVVLGLMVYASILTLRGLWLGPLLVERQGMTLVQSGNVALVMSILMLLGAPLFGRMDPGPRWRRSALMIGTIVMAGLFGLLALSSHAWVAIGVPLAVGALASYAIWQYADVRDAYPAQIMGRAIGLFTMAMFLGVALMQAFTGWVAGQAQAIGVEPFSAVFFTIAALLLLGAFGFWVLPKPAAQARGC